MISPSFKNINSFPPSVQPLIIEFSNKLLNRLGENVFAVLVYGSAAGGNYNPAVSNINLAVIVKELDFSVLKKNVDLVKWGRKHKIATPLFLTLEYIMFALDVFPLEFTEIKDQHVLIFGEDVFENLEIPDKDIRLLCEQQVKGKLLHLRQAYLDIGANPSILKNVLTKTLNDLIPVFRQLIILKSKVHVQNNEELFDVFARLFSLDLEPFLTVYHDKSRKIIISSRQVEGHLKNFLIQLESLSRHLDSL